MGDSRPDPARSKGIRPILLGGVFILKLVVVLQLKDHPLLQPDAGLDTTAYADLARRVVEGDLGLGPGLYFVSPLYIYFLAPWLALFDSFTAVRLIQALLGTGSVALVFLTGREWFGERSAWLAAALAAFTGLFTFYEALILQASIDAFLTSAALFTLTLALRRHTSRWMLSSGVVFGLASLNRPNMLLAVAGIALALVVLRPPWRTTFRLAGISAAAVLLAGVLAGLSPALLRNIVVARQWTMVSSHGGLNFYIGNGLGATGFFREIPGIRPDISGQEKDARRVAEAATGRVLTESEASDYFFGLARSWIQGHPGEALALFAKKLGFVFSAQHIALPHSYPFYAYDSGTMLRFYVIGPGLLVPLGLAGLIFAAPPGDRKDYLAWIAFVPAYAVGVAAFFVAERYRLPLLVPLCVGAGAALDRVIPRADTVNDTKRQEHGRKGGFFEKTLPYSLAPVSGRSSRRLLATVSFAVLFIAVNWPHKLHDGRWEEGLRMSQRLVVLGRYDEAERMVPAVAAREPRPGVTDYGLGVQFLQAKQNAPAIAHLSRSAQLDPDQPRVRYALGQALLGAGRASEAVPHLRAGFGAGGELPGGGYDLAVALKEVGDFSGAADVIRRVTPPDTGDPEAYLRLGRLAAQVRAPEAAEPFFRRAAQLGPGQAATRQQFGLNLLVLGRFEEAALELAESVRLDPGNPDSLAHLAYCEAKLGRAAAARAHAAAALARDPNHALARRLVVGLGG